MIDGTHVRRAITGLYAVIGNPIRHSKSPGIHQAFAAQTGQDLDYVTIEGTAGRFVADVDAFRARGGLGLNITTPFKLDAFAYATALQPGARQAGAVNCLSFEGAAAAGANFDGVGLLRDIERNLGVPVRDRRVLLLGAGGAARGALLPFLDAGPATLVLANRNPAKACAVIEEAGPHDGLLATGYHALSGQFDIVVNATSASMAGEMPAIPSTVFARGCLAYEMAYGRGMTPFLRQAKDAGVANLVDGVGMLVEQAAEAFAWWRGVRPDTAPVIARMTVPLT